MTIIDLKKEKMAALKAHDEAKQAILGLLISSYQKMDIETKANGQVMNEQDVTSILMKAKKELEDEKEMYKKAAREEAVKTCERQISIVESYLPKMMSEEEIREVIAALEDKSIGNIMRTFKRDYQGKVDMSLVNKVAKESAN